VTAFVQPISGETFW
jgi:transposase